MSLEICSFREEILKHNKNQLSIENNSDTVSDMSPTNKMDVDSHQNNSIHEKENPKDSDYYKEDQQTGNSSTFSMTIKFPTQYIVDMPRNLHINNFYEDSSDVNSLTCTDENFLLFPSGNERLYNNPFNSMYNN